VNELEDKWWVELDGDDFTELEELAWLCSHPCCTLCSITKKQTFETDKSSFSAGEAAYYLKSSRFAELTDAQAVREEATKIIQMVKAAAKLESNYEFQSIGLGGTVVRVESGLPNEVQVFFFAPVTSAHEIAIRPIKTVNAQDISTLKETQQDNYLNHLDDMIDDPYTYETLSYFGEPPSWLSLWNTYEMIKFDVDGNLNHEFGREKCKITEYGWAEKEELEDFTTTANHYLAKGKPRHSRARILDEERKRKKGNLVREQTKEGT
jgi:hypothetical protein